MTDMLSSTPYATNDFRAPPAMPPGLLDHDSEPHLAGSDSRLKGRVILDTLQLRQLRQTRLMSQQDLADDCWRRNIRVSIATIKRAESGRAVRFRIARELARCFDVPVMRIVRA